MARALKVYRTAIGFHDAYVAAPNRKAALAAWGSDHDLFARGVAEAVTDEALTAEPQARPGEVVKRLRGTAAEQIAALPPDPPKRAAVTEAGPKPVKASPGPRPDRSALEAAERALAEAEDRQRAASAELAEEEARLAARRKALKQEQAAELARLNAACGAADEAYRRAVRQWRG